MKNLKRLLTLTLATSCFSLTVSAAIPKLENKSFEDLVKAAKNTSLSMTERWQSLIKAGEVAKPSQMEEIKEFTTSQEWFMRNAALVSLESISKDVALSQAKELIKDKALVVRSAAVTTLTKKNSAEVRRLLVDEMGKKYNFSGSQSLWIRPQIMKHLAQTAGMEDRRLLCQFLFDSDKKVASLSAQGLEKLTNIHFSGTDSIQKWQNHAKKNGWM